MDDLYQHGKNHCYVENYLNYSQSSVSTLLTQYSKSGKLQNNCQNYGWKLKTSDTDDKKLKLKVKKNHSESVRILHRKCKKAVEVSTCLKNWESSKTERNEIH